MLRSKLLLRHACVWTLALLTAACFDKTTETTEAAAEAPASVPSPRLTGAVSRSNTTVLVSFSKPMGASALDVGNYAVAQQNVNSEAGRLNVLSAAFDGTTSTAVMLTTRSQSDVSYRLTVTNMRDAEGNALAPEGGDARTTDFAGTAPRATDLVDTDGDTLSDSEEQRGWSAMILLDSNEGVSWQVSSDPVTADSDSDGLRDDVEKRLNIDPRDSDTDGDELSDYQEVREIFSSAGRQDTDGDGLMDGREFNAFRTSPVHRDTDGDQLADGEEVLLARRNPRAADVPLPAIEIGNVDLRLDVRFTATSAQGTRELETQSVGSTLQQTASKKFSNSDTTAHEVTAKATFEAEYSAKADSPGWNFKGSVEAGYTGTWTSQFTAESSNETQKTVARTFQTDQEVTQNETVQREVRAASIRVPLSIKSLGSIAFTIENLQVTAFLQDPHDPGRLVPIATLVRDASAGVPNRFNLGPLVPERGPFLFTNDQIFPSLVEDLMLDPRGLVFKVSNFDIIDELGRNFAFTSQAIIDRTTPLVIDYGGADADADGEGDTTDRFHVATSGGRPIADTNGDGRIDSGDRRVVFDPQGRTVGITVGEALESIVDLKHFDEDTQPTSSLGAGDIATSFSTRVIDGVRVLWRIRDVSKELGNPLRQWEILTPEGIARRDSDFLGRVIAPQSGITLAHVQDLDDDRIPANWEFIHGCSDRSADTDRDGVNDGDELFRGWTINISGRGTYRTFSSCARADSDRDGLSDAQESTRVADLDTDGDGVADQFGVAAPTDPKRPDTDEDGVSDSEELNGYVIGTRVTFVDADSDCTLLNATSNPPTILCTSDPLDPDSDGDTLKDGDEVTLGTDPTVDDGDRVFDNDADGLSNFDETSGTTVTFRRVSTTRLEDGELVTCTTQVDGIAECDGANEPTSDPEDPDTDNDGIRDDEERELGTHPRRADTDGDGRTDRLELDVATATCNGEPISAETGPLDADGDNDLLSDGAEIAAWTNGSWVIRVVDQTPYVACPNPTQADADLDQLVDGQERELVKAGSPTPTDPNLADTDQDGFPDLREAASTRPTNPLAADQWVEFRYTRIDALADCEGFLDSIGEFFGILALQRGTLSEDVFELRAPPFNFFPMQAGDSVPVNVSRRHVLRPGNSVRAFSREFYECDGSVCFLATPSDDDLAEGDVTFTFTSVASPIESSVTLFAHTCGSEAGLQTTLVVTDLQ